MKKIFWHITIITIIIISAITYTLCDYGFPTKTAIIIFSYISLCKSLKKPLLKMEKEFNKAERKGIFTFIIMMYISLASLFTISIFFADLVKIKSAVFMVCALFFLYMINDYLHALISVKHTFTAAEIDENLLMK